MGLSWKESKLLFTTCSVNNLITPFCSKPYSSSSSSFCNSVNPIIADVFVNITKFFPDSLQLSDGLASVIEEAYLSSDLDLKIEAAIIFGNGFRFPKVCHIADIAELESMAGDLENLILSRQRLLSPRRFNHLNVDYICSVLPGRKDNDLLRSIVDGIPVVLDPKFIADPFPPTPSPLYLRAACAVNLSWYDLYLKGFILLFPTAALQRWQLSNGFRLSYSRAGWAKKRGKPQGRPTTNLSYDNHKGGLINTPYVRDALRTHYGEIHPAQLDEIVGNINVMASAHGWDNITLWKMDLLGAYNLVHFKAADAGLLAMELSDNLTAISMVGHFGWMGTPFAFDVLSRTIVDLIRLGIHGLASIATDDIIGISPTIHVDFDLSFADKSIHDIFTDDCVNSEKTMKARVMDAIGWNLNLDLRRVGIAKHNLLKTLHGFMTIKLGEFVTVKVLMKLASWASRYVTICRYMKPFSAYLHCLTQGLTNLDSQKEIDLPTFQIIQLWTMFLSLMSLNPIHFTRSFESFSPQSVKIFINVDASLTGIGILIYGVCDSGSLSLLAVSGFNTPYLLNGDSSYQNSMEFIAVVCAILLCVRIGISRVGVSLQGDSETALSWAASERFRSTRVLGASCLFVNLLIGSGMDIVESHHIEGLLNTTSDKLSRGISALELGFPAYLIVDFLSCLICAEIITAMDPLQYGQLDSPEIHQIFAHSRVLVDSFLQTCQQ